MSDKTVRMIIAGLLALALGFALNTTRLIIVAAGAEGHTHDGEVGKFYQSWKQPDIEGYGGRVASCCGNQDCRPILAFRRSPGGWQVQVEGPDGHGGLAVSGWY
ncbi:MAG TPA: hypothetical protein VEO53_13660, partial [Candidatus Binatia bacterium]|nr:hypothetical protein [Candidatus Binatia bacterium]